MKTDKKAKKTFVSVAVVVATMVMLVFFASAAYLGDADNDGKVKAGDARTILRHAAKIELISDEACLKLSDVDGNGKIAAADARLALRMASKIDPLVEVPTTENKFGDWTSLNENEHQRVCVNDPSVVETAAHNWDEGKITKEASLWTEGEKIYICKVCGKEKMEIIPRKVSEVNVGDKLYLGSYEKNPIEWVVLEKDENRILVLSRFGIESMDYWKYTKVDTVNWKNCSIRSWLNNEFYYKSFSYDEKKLISETSVKTEIPYQADALYTSDKIFLLSISEAKQYFSTNEERMCLPTFYAVQRGVSTSLLNIDGSPIDSINGEATCSWWLRSCSGNKAAWVNSAGILCYDGSGTGYGGRFVGNYNPLAVRPAMWIDT